MHGNGLVEGDRGFGGVLSLSRIVTVDQAEGLVIEQLRVIEREFPGEAVMQFVSIGVRDGLVQRR